jgi:hypothetical protein
MTGLTEIRDEGKGEGREGRAKVVERGVNAEGARLVDDVIRLMKAVRITDIAIGLSWWSVGLDGKFGKADAAIWMGTYKASPVTITRLAILLYDFNRRSWWVRLDLARNELHPASSIFVPLPTSPLHYFTARVTPSGLVFELLKLARVTVPATATAAAGSKMDVGDRIVVEVQKLRDRRLEKGKGKGRRTEKEGSLATASKYVIYRNNIAVDSCVTALRCRIEIYRICIFSASEYSRGVTISRRWYIDGYIAVLL